MFSGWRTLSNSVRPTADLRMKSMSRNSGIASWMRQSPLTALLFMPAAQLSSTVPRTALAGSTLLAMMAARLPRELPTITTPTSGPASAWMTCPTKSTSCSAHTCMVNWSSAGLEEPPKPRRSTAYTLYPASASTGMFFRNWPKLAPKPCTSRMGGRLGSAPSAGSASRNCVRMPLQRHHRGVSPEGVVRCMSAAASCQWKSDIMAHSMAVRVSELGVGVADSAARASPSALRRPTLALCDLLAASSYTRRRERVPSMRACAKSARKELPGPAGVSRPRTTRCSSEGCTFS
mmetsp:Transcript_3642/g.9342  ORF Transcript_3642/g.9342 Transcript_3642/m.9342 type:complete len:291 (-) Transcript_3642:352-1224(-)